MSKYSGRASGYRGGGAGGARRNGPPATPQTVAQVLERYSSGPRTGVFTDGSCSGNPGPGGWGTVYVIEGRILAQDYGYESHTTNNRMELTAMITGLNMLGPSEPMDVYTDSQLVVNTLTQWAAGWARNGWKRRDGEVKNLDLVQEAYRLLMERPLVQVRWIKAHDGSLWNEYADSLATAYMRTAL